MLTEIAVRGLKPRAQRFMKAALVNKNLHCQALLN